LFRIKKKLPPYFAPQHFEKQLTRCNSTCT